DDTESDTETFLGPNWIVIFDGAISNDDHRIFGQIAFDHLRVDLHVQDRSELKYDSEFLLGDVIRSADLSETQVIALGAFDSVVEFLQAGLCCLKPVLQTEQDAVDFVINLLVEIVNAALQVLKENAVRRIADVGRKTALFENVELVEKRGQSAVGGEES